MLKLEVLAVEDVDLLVAVGDVEVGAGSVLHQKYY